MNRKNIYFNAGIIMLCAIALLCLCLLVGCTPKNVNDYSSFPNGTVCKGQLKDGNALYLIRTAADGMSGVCFVDEDRAVTEDVSFTADAAGTTLFQVNGSLLKGEMKVEAATKVIVLSLPAMLNRPSQTVRLTVQGSLPDALVCKERYKEPLFGAIDALKDVQYGEATGYYTSRPIDYISKEDYAQIFGEMFKAYKEAVIEQGMTSLPLKMDVYQPRNDQQRMRPLVAFVHGGSFFFGDKENLMQQALTDYLVRRGYVVASLNYRLCSTLLGKDAIERAVYRGVQDVRAALRYLSAHSADYRIDPARCFLAGSSAGGIIALTAAFMDQDEVYRSVDEGIFRQRQHLGGLDASGNSLTDAFSITGVISMWGGVTDLQMLDNPVPTLLFHGTDDDIIPCNEGLPFRKYMGEWVHGIMSMAGKLYGSEAVSRRLRSLDVPARYVPFNGFGHEAQIEPDGSLNANMQIIKDETGAFLLENLFDYTLTGNTQARKTDAALTYRLDSVRNATVQWRVEGGFITEQTSDAIRVIWYNSSSVGKVTACITDTNGVSCHKVSEITIIH